MSLLESLVRNVRGASAAEYALILGIVGAAIALAAMNLGSTVATTLNVSSDNIRTCGGGC